MNDIPFEAGCVDSLKNTLIITPVKRWDLIKVISISDLV